MNDDTFLYIVITIALIIFAGRYLNVPVGYSGGLDVSVSITDASDTSGRQATVTYGGSNVLALVTNLRVIVSVKNSEYGNSYSNIRIISASPGVLDEACTNDVIFRTNAITGWVTPSDIWIAYDIDNDGILNGLGYASTLTSCPPAEWASAEPIGETPATTGTYSMYKSDTQIGVCVDETHFYIFEQNMGQAPYAVTTGMPVDPYHSNGQEIAIRANIDTLAVGETKTMYCDISSADLNALIGDPMQPWSVTVIGYDNTLAKDTEPQTTLPLDVYVGPDTGGYIIQLGVSNPVVSYRTNSALSNCPGASPAVTEIAVDYDNDGDLDCFKRIGTSTFTSISSAIAATPQGTEIYMKDADTIIFRCPGTSYHPYADLQATCTTIPLVTYPVEPYTSTGQETIINS